jgi:hypothetical protein
MGVMRHHTMALFPVIIMACIKLTGILIHMVNLRCPEDFPTFINQ